VRIAVTGGRGRLGRYVVAALAKGHEVRVLDRSAPSEGASAFPAVDVLDEAALAAAVRDQEAVIHLAAIDRSMASAPGELFETNVRGTWNVLEAAEKAGVRRFILCSSSSALGLDDTNPEMPPLYLPVDEAHPARATSTYGMSKHIGELMAAAAARRGGIEVIAMRPTYVAFPEMIPFLEGTSGLQADREAEPPPYLRSYVGPADAAQAFRLAVEQKYGGFEIFHISAADTFIAEPTLDHIRRTYGSLPPVRQPELYRENPLAGVYDIRRAREGLGWQPATSWDDLRAAAR
jgi:UDP-glucose 4-epimerase